MKLVHAGLKTKAELITNLIAGQHYYNQTGSGITEYWYDENNPELFCFKITSTNDILLQVGTFMPSAAHVKKLHIKAEWWLELDGDIEILCMVWDENSLTQKPAYVKKYHSQMTVRKYEDVLGNLWQYARPVVEYDYKRSTKSRAKTWDL